MNLSNLLLDKIATRLNLREDNLYFNKLKKSAALLESLKEKPSNLHDVNDFVSYTEEPLKEDFVIVYIISVHFTRANTLFHLSDAKGKSKLFFTAGSVNLSGKRKRNRKAAITRLSSLLAKKASFVGKKPVALHLVNVKSSFRTLLVKKLKPYFFIKLIKKFSSVPFNGCRKRKLRRKKVQEM